MKASQCCVAGLAVMILALGGVLLFATAQYAPPPPVKPSEEILKKIEEHKEKLEAGLRLLHHVIPRARRIEIVHRPIAARRDDAFFQGFQTGANSPCRRDFASPWRCLFLREGCPKSFTQEAVHARTPF
jgi:hypothetical protein